MNKYEKLAYKFGGFSDRSSWSSNCIRYKYDCHPINVDTVDFTTFSNTRYVDGQTNSTLVEICVYN